MKRCLLFLLLIASFSRVNACQNDSVQIHLITILPHAKGVHTIYGHTALRVYDPTQSLDLVFNWGTFDFNAPYFLFRFIKGETDYFLSYIDYDSFLQYTGLDNVIVEEQSLDIPPEGKERILQMLSDNLLPQNRVYRYNFLFDNCTTRVHDLIENGLNEPLTYPESTDPLTFRKLIHSCTRAYPWTTFGIDLLVGSGADSLISLRRQLFLPLCLKNAMDNVCRQSFNGDCLPLVLSSEQILTAVPRKAQPLKFWDSPLQVGWLVWLVYILIAAAGGWKYPRFGIFFVPLWLLASASGSLLAFMVLFSEHPCMSPNWNLLWLHPLHWMGFAGCFFKKASRLIICYHTVNFIVLLGVLIGWHWLPQALNPADIPYILGLMSASLVVYLCNKRLYRKECVIEQSALFSNSHSHKSQGNTSIPLLPD